MNKDKIFRILELQEKFEKGLIKEDDLTENEKMNLVKLYKYQINVLNQEIKQYDDEFKSYKEKILIARKKLEHK